MHGASHKCKQRLLKCVQLRVSPYITSARSAIEPKAMPVASSKIIMDAVVEMKIKVRTSPGRLVLCPKEYEFRMPSMFFLAFERD